MLQLMKILKEHATGPVRSLWGIGDTEPMASLQTTANPNSVTPYRNGTPQPNTLMGCEGLKPSQESFRQHRGMQKARSVTCLKDF